MLFIDVKYANLLSSRTRNFKKKNDYLWNLSCPICGDSQTKKTKARGYIFRKKADLFYRCHNCGYSTNLGNLLKFLDSNLYNEYVVERYKNNVSKYSDHKIEEILEVSYRKPIVSSVKGLEGLKCVDNLDEGHPVRKYVESRVIPREHWKNLYYTPKFKKYVNTLRYKFESEENDHPRLVIPFFSEDGKELIAIQGRAFGDEQPKYYTIKMDDEKVKVFGLERVDVNRRVYVLEGPIDSLFVPNAIAVAGSTFDIPFVKKLKDFVIVPDNQPRNIELVKLIEKYIAIGFPVCLFPDTLEQKDINEMVQNGMDVKTIPDVINTNTFVGLGAMLKLTEWRKC